MRNYLLLFLFFIVIGFLPVSVDAAVAIDATTDDPVGTNDRNFTHTPVGTPTKAVVVISQRYGAEGIETNGVTYGGQVMTRAVGAFAFVGVYIYYLDTPPTGAQTVSVNFVAGSATRSRKITSITLTGTGTGVNITDSSGASSGTSITDNVTTTVNDCYIYNAFAGTNTGAPSITGGQTSISSGTWTSGSYGHSYEVKATAGAESLSWSFTTGENQSASAAFCAPASGGSSVKRQTEFFFD